MNVNGKLNLLMKICNAEVTILPSVAAVYSNEFTSIKGAGKGDSSAPVPLPYFVLAQKLMSKRAADMSKLKSEIATLKEQ